MKRGQRCWWQNWVRNQRECRSGEGLGYRVSRAEKKGRGNERNRRGG